MLVDLLNTRPGVTRSEDALATPEQLEHFAAVHDFTGPLDATVFDVAVVAALRERFSKVAEIEVGAVVDAINLTFREIRVFPQLVCHGRWDWHLHATDNAAPLSERMASDIALVLTDQIRSGDLSRLRTCAAQDCCAVFADFTKNNSKRFCDVRNCANRTSVAAYRARRSAHAPE